MSQAEKVVGRYEVLREIGRGGMASVFLARQADLDRLIALKELRAIGDGDPNVAQRFLQEARLAGSLSHPNIVTVHDYFVNDAVPYIAMEYLERGSLRPYVGRLSLGGIGGVLEGLLAGLSEAERHGVVHRDIKPENLLVTADGGVKIADFGIARATNVLEQTAHLTATGMTVGTPSYIAPEQALGREVGPWTDLYAAGITAFELVTGRTPFADTKEAMGIVLRHINEVVPPVTAFVPNVDPWLARWIAWLVAKEPAARPQSAAQAWEALDEVFIRLLGPRWRRGARVVDSVAALTPATVPQAAPDPRLAVTAAPQRKRAKPAPAAAVAPRPRRGVSRAAKIGMLVAVISALGALAGTRGGSSTPPATPATPATPSASSVAASPAPAVATQPTSAELASRATAARTVAAAYRKAGATKTARAYERAATAAASGDVAGYNTALADAAATQATGTNKSASVVTTSVPAPTPIPQAVVTQPAPTQRPVPQSSGNCAGDSTSDDPSDDSCNP